MNLWRRATAGEKAGIVIGCIIVAEALAGLSFLCYLAWNAVL